MKLDPEELERLSALLDTALDLPEPDRVAWLASLSGEALALAPALRDLLARHASRETADLVDRMPTFTMAGEATSSAQFSAGEAVGPYRLVRELGRGGMGEVWLAERVDGHLKRAVALKLPMLSARRSVLVQRFARERDILGSLAHPHIARLYDAGLADDGQPYLALEYVQGQPITAYCADKGLDAHARVALLRQVMDAVQYAHANLVIHRDLKPSNVLVTAEGRAMLLDFGIAKLLQDEQAQAQETELTQLGGRALTLDYAAPEQVAGGPVSIATDVHALGALLYELLAGRRPFEADTRTQLEQAVLNSEPARPSQGKDGVIAKLPRGLAADLDTIVLKALKKVPGERYATVNALAEDLDRFTRGEAVHAQPDRMGYRLRKFVARHRVPVIAGSLVAVALISVSALALVQANEARRQATAAQQEAKRAQAVQAFLTDLFQANTSDQADPQAAQRTTARELLDRGAARVDAALRDEPQVRFEVLRTLASMYWQLSLETQASSIEARRVELARQIYDKTDVRLAEVLLDYAQTISESERRDSIPALVDEALATLDAAGDRSSEVRGQSLVIASEYWSHESLLRSIQTADEAVAFLQRHHPDSDWLIQAHLRAARGRIYQGEFDAAAARAEQGMATAKRKGDAAPAWLWLPASALADTYSAQLKLDRAEAQLRDELALAVQVNGEDHARTLTSKARLGNLLLEIGRSSEGTAMHDAVRQAMQASGPRMDQIQRQFILGILGLRMLERGRPDLLTPILQADIEELRRTIPNSGVVIQRQRLWAALQATMGNHVAARETIAAALAQWNRFADGSPSAFADSAFALGRAQVELAAGNPGAALALLEPTRSAAPRDALVRPLVRARALLALGRNSEAVDAANSALAALTTLPPGYRPVVVEADARLLIGQARLALGDSRAAEQELAAALDLRRRHDAPDSLWVAQAQIALATCQLQLGRRDAARQLLANAGRIHSVLGEAAKPQAAALGRAQAVLAGRDVGRNRP